MIYFNGPMDEIEQWRNKALHFSRSNKLGHLLTRMLELIQSVIVTGTKIKSLPLKVQALSMECDSAMAEDPTREDPLIALHYGVTFSITALLNSLTSKEFSRNRVVDEIELLRNKALLFSRTDNLGQLIMSSIELLQSVVVIGPKAQSLPFKIKALSMECSSAMADDKNRDESLRSLHYGVTFAICALLTSLHEESKKELHSKVNLHNAIDDVQQSDDPSFSLEEDLFSDCEMLESLPPEITNLVGMCNEMMEVGNEDVDVHGGNSATFEDIVPDSSKGTDNKGLNDSFEGSSISGGQQIMKAEARNGSRTLSEIESMLPEFKRRSRMNEGDKTFACGECERKFSAKSSLIRHIRYDHEMKPYSCQECGVSFGQYILLQEHKNTHFSSGSEIQEQTINIERSSNHEFNKSVGNIGVEEINFPCPHCNKIFKYRSILRRHLLHHAGEKLFACNKCDAKFMHNNGLKSHLRSKHGEIMFTCKKCGAEFERMIFLAKHEAASCSGVVPVGDRENVKRASSYLLKCNQCDRTFSCRSKLVVHNRQHTGEKPFACGECGKSFIVKSSLNKHLRRGHGIKPYPCAKCDAEFERYSQWFTHESTAH